MKTQGWPYFAAQRIATRGRAEEGWDAVKHGLGQDSWDDAAKARVGLRYVRPDTRHHNPPILLAWFIGVEWELFGGLGGCWGLGCVQSSSTPLPHLGDVQEAVNTLEVDEESVVGHGRDGALAELLGVGAGEVGHVLDHLGRGGLGDLSLAEGQEAHVDAAELLVNLQWRKKGVAVI